MKKRINASYPYGEPWREPAGQPRLYGGKERERFQGMNDYGFHARRYNSATTLWNAPDPLAAKYPNLSPYVYCASNPILYIDPTGQRVVTMIDDVEYEYRDGDGGYGFYNNDDELYNGDDDFVNRLFADLGQLRSKLFGKVSLNHLINHEETIRIKESNKNSYNDATNTVSFFPDSKAETLVFDENGDKVFEERASYIGLAHELLGHGIDDLNGGLDKSLWFMGKRPIRMNEKTAIRIENAIRHEHGKPYRAGYGKFISANGEYIIAVKGLLYEKESDVSGRFAQWLHLLKVINSK